MGEVAALLGLAFMPWQQLVADVALEIDPVTGRLVYREIDLLVPRQSGKTTELLALMVHRATSFRSAQRIAYTAQTRSDARAKWEDDHLPILEASPFRKAFRKRLTNGHEAVLWRNGSKHALMASTQKSGHGPTLDLAVIDEAFAQVDSRMEQANKPAMITRPEPQLWVVSTAGRSPSSSPYLWSKVERGRRRCAEGQSSRTAYFEWSAPDDAPRDDPATWLGCMPALGHTIELSAVEADLESMDPAEFDRAYLNRWNPHAIDAVIPSESWMLCRDRESQPGESLSFAFDVTPDRGAASIGVASLRADGRVHVEVIDSLEGTGWVVPRLIELLGRWSGQVVCDPAGPAGGLLSALANAGLTVETVTVREHAQACGALFDDVVEGRLAHLGQPELEAAVAGACRRSVTDAWLWDRRSSNVDISPLVAVTLARWSALSVNDAAVPGYYGSDG